MSEPLERVSKVVGGGVRLLAVISGLMLMALMVRTVVAVSLRKANDPIIGT